MTGIFSLSSCNYRLKMVSLSYMLDDVFNYTPRSAPFGQSRAPEGQIVNVCSAIEQALTALARALELLKSMQQDSVQRQQQTVQEVSASQSVLTKETLATTFVEFKSTALDTVQSDQKIIEGFFNGESMVDGSGHIYSVPANYASKSKLVEGDGMKLIVTKSGSFVYKQIAPAERTRCIGTLEQADSREYYVRVADRRFRVLTASVTYYKGISGDEVIILTPKSAAGTWAAVENIIKTN